MKIEILCSGCSKCRKLEKNTEQALKEKGTKAQIVKVDDIVEIADRGVMMTPALSIDGIVKSSGKVLSVDEIKKIIE